MCSSIRQQIVAAANRYVGTPWRRYGRSEFGVDCVGLLICVAKDLNLCSYDNQSYSKEYKYEDLISNLVKAGCNFIPRYKIDIGDILVMAHNSVGVHAAIYCGMEDNRVIHAHIRDKQVMISSFTKYEKIVTSQYTFPGVT